MGGFYIIEAESLAEALECAQRARFIPVSNGVGYRRFSATRLCWSYGIGGCATRYSPSSKQPCVPRIRFYHGQVVGPWHELPPMFTPILLTVRPLGRVVLIVFSR